MAWSDAARKAAAEARKRRAKGKKWNTTAEMLKRRGFTSSSAGAQMGSYQEFRARGVSGPIVTSPRGEQHWVHRRYGVESSGKGDPVVAQGYGTTSLKKYLKSKKRDRAIRQMYKDVRKKLGNPSSYTHTQFSDEIIRESRRRKL